MGRCRESRIIIDTSTLEKIVYDPRTILEDEGAFWEEEKPQKYTKLWAEAVGYTIPFDEWREKIRAWAELSPGERRNHELMRNSQAIIEGREDFMRKAIPHLCSYLPADADLDVMVRLTAFIGPNAFAWEDIIININSGYWKGRIENVLNMLVHEIFHAGYSYCREQREEEELEDKTLYKMLDNLHSEGICTYVGYRALPLFPAPDVEDYRMLESQEKVESCLRDVNEAFSKVGEGEEAVQQFVWERRILGRAYYVVGAYMCQVIEDRAGLEKVIETLVQGPASFVKLYNSVVEEESRVRAGL
jgi:hypothetical protein